MALQFLLLRSALPVPLPLLFLLCHSFSARLGYLKECHSWEILCTFSVLILAPTPAFKLFLLRIQLLTILEKFYFSSETLLNFHSHPESNPKLFCSVSLSLSAVLKASLEMFLI